MYADDCAVIVSADSREEVSLKLENVIVLLKNWFKSNNLLMNLKKNSFYACKKKLFELKFLEIVT